jgi:CTP synthase (UTP-ammonia lyase)
LAICAAVSGGVSLGVGLWIARAGGQVSHSEFRTGAPPPAEPQKAGGVSRRKSARIFSKNKSYHMKTTPFIAIGLGCMLGLISPYSGFAQDHAGTAEANEKVSVPDTANGVIKAIEEQPKQLAATVAAKKLAEVHEHAFAMRDLAKALPAKLDSNHKKMVAPAVRRIAQVAEELDSSGDAGDQNATEANLKKMDSALATLEEHATM